MTGPDFTEEQKQYLQGFFAGILTRRGAGAASAAPIAIPGTNGAGPVLSPAAPAPSGPEAIHRAAQDRFLAEGKKLTAEEMAKRTKNPFDMWDEMRANAATGEISQGHRRLPAQVPWPVLRGAGAERLHVPAAHARRHPERRISCAGLPTLAEIHAGGYADITTRANLQIREIAAGSIIEVLTGIQELGLTSRGSGADNIRNITGSPTAGIDPHELIDTRPLARALHYPILNHRELYGLPRKFNIALRRRRARRGARGHQRHRLCGRLGRPRARRCRPASISACGLGGITGHGDFARDTGVHAGAGGVRARWRLRWCASSSTTATAPTARKARLKYVLERWGLDGFVAEAEKHLPSRLRRFPLERCAPRKPQPKGGHLGVHPQRQAGTLLYRRGGPGRAARASPQMRGLADIAARHGSGTLRLTVWQNLLISDMPEHADRRRARRRSARSASTTRRRPSAPASSPAPAIPAASSR